MKANKQYIIGITGGIASGKSNVSSYLEYLGYAVIDADKIAHEISFKGSPFVKSVVQNFGENILDEDGELDRRALAKIVFEDSTKLSLLNSLSHPIIFKTIEDRLSKIDDAIVFLDIPLLFETGYDKNCYEVWCVYVPYEEQLRRLMKRSELTKEEADNIIKSQMPTREKLRLSKRHISTLGSYDETYAIIDRHVDDFKKEHQL